MVLVGQTLSVWKPVQTNVVFFELFEPYMYIYGVLLSHCGFIETSEIKKQE